MHMQRLNYEVKKKPLEPFNIKQLFLMSNHDPDDKVSAVCSSLTGMHVGVGTMRGKVYFINRFSGELERKFEPHDKKITGIFIRDQHSIVTSSNDGTIHVQSLKA